MKTKIEQISPDVALREMKLWKANGFSTSAAEYETLWSIFRTVVTSSSWGTSEYGGPVWLMDFSLANFKKLFPDNPWILYLEDEAGKGKNDSLTAVSKPLCDFYNWFYRKSKAFVNQLGLGNVIVKMETKCLCSGGNIILYGSSAFLDYVKNLTCGRLGIVDRPDKMTMLQFNYSLREFEIVKNGDFLCSLSNGGMTHEYPMRFIGLDFVRTSSVYGDCFILKHPSITEDYVVPETCPEKFLIFIINDLMECKAQNRDGVGFEEWYRIANCPYPKMRFEQYLKNHYACDLHFCPTSNVFDWWRHDYKTEMIEVDFPQIDVDYGEFWHRQFPLKQHWRVCEIW